MRRTRHLLFLAVAGLLATVAAPLAASAEVSATSASPRIDPGVKGCDVLLTAPVGHDCLLPWPNNAFTVASTKTPTGRLLAVPSSLDPTNTRGAHVATTYIDKSDGFSPGSVLMTYVANVDLAASHVAASTDIGSSLAANSPIVVLDTKTGARVAYFAELDAQTANASEQLLMIHPAVALTEGHRYAVVLRNLVDTSAHPIPPLASTTAAWNATSKSSARLKYLSKVLHIDLRSVIGTSEPYMAWDFTVASSKSLAGPALAMHTLAYRWLATHHLAYKGSTSIPAADYAPAFTVTSSSVANGIRNVKGTYQVPLFLKDTSAFSSMDSSSSGLPVINGAKTWTADFICVLPSAISGSGAAIPAVYGHGLLGSAAEVQAGNVETALTSSNIAACATDWVGMSAGDILNVERNLANMSTFNTQTDHMLQGLVNFQFLGRLLNSPAGFASSPAFQASGKPLFQVGKTVFMGYSQGGIMGGAASAVSTEWTRVILGVPGMDYGGLLLNRSVDWNEFASIYDKAYTNPVDQQVVLQLAQLLWDRGENDGYAEHLTSNTYPGIPAKQVFMIENYGDHQVTNLSAEMLARTIGAANHQPAFNPSYFGQPDRLNTPVVAQWGIPKLNQSLPVRAGLVLWDYGTPTPPTNNLAPNGPAYGADPHGDGWGNAKLLVDVLAFLKSGEIPDVCGGLACQSNTP